MTSPIKWLPQEMSPVGDFVAEAFLKLLDPGTGGISLSEPELLVRETAQNSWDSRRTELESPVSMSFIVTTLRKGERVHDAFTEFFGDYAALRKDRRPAIKGLSELVTRLQSNELDVLIVRDVGTHGLGGPVDARVEVKDEGSNRYVKFMLNIGDKNRDTTAGGGFGMGRSVFWRMSECRTVIVYSRCKVGKSIESRLVGLTFTDQFSLDGINHTGRHWWTDSDVGRPLIGTDADDWARRLGIQPYGSEETGTTVIVVAPPCPAGPKDLATSIARSIELHLWPKYVSVSERAPRDTMTFSVTVNDERVKVRDREELRGTVLGSYIACFAELLHLERDGSNGTDSTPPLKSTVLSATFKNRTLPQVLGRLVTNRDSSPDGPPMTPGSDDEIRAFAPAVTAQFTTLVNCVALLRTPELVVCYREIVNKDRQSERVVGVFKSSEEANQYFKDAEGSTHNDWDPDRMEKNHKVFVKKFKKSLDDQISFWHHTAPPSPTGGGSKLATHRISASIGEGFSDWARGLGGRSPGEEGSEGTSGGAGRGGGPRRARGNVDVEAGPIEVANGRRINVWKIVVGHPGPGTVNVGLREADEEAAVMSPTASAPGGFPTLSELTADREIVLDGSDAPSKRFEFPVDPMEPNITDVMVRVTGSATTTIFVRGLFDEGTLPVLVASFDADGTTS